MAISVPPKPPALVATGDDGRFERLRFRLWQLTWTMVTVFATVWICLLGVPLLAIIAIAVAKHVLVALLIIGLDIYPAHPN